MPDQQVNQAIIEVILPQLYHQLDEMLTHINAGTKPSTKEITEARKLLVSWCDNSLIKGL